MFLVVTFVPHSFLKPFMFTPIEVLLAHSICATTHSKTGIASPLSPNGTMTDWVRNPYLDDNRKMNISANGTTSSDVCTSYDPNVTAYHCVNLTN